MKTKKLIRKEISSNEVQVTCSKGLSIHEKKAGGKVVFYEKDMVDSLLRKNILKKYKTLIKQLYFYLSADDDSGTAIQEALNEVHKFREELRNKYRKVLKEKEIERLEKELFVMEQETLRKQYVMNELYLLNSEKEQNRSR